jgi:hypothetical protein
MQQRGAAWNLDTAKSLVCLYLNSHTLPTLSHTPPVPIPIPIPHYPNGLILCTAVLLTHPRNKPPGERPVPDFR